MSRLSSFLMLAAILLPFFAGKNDCKLTVPAGLAESNSAVSIAITESGLQPAVLSIQVGTSVTWTNQTTRTIHLFDGEPYYTYLPVLMRNPGNTALSNTSSPQNKMIKNQASYWLDVLISPGGQYTYTFSTSGNFPYFAMNGPVRFGTIVVEEVALFTSVLYMPNDTGSASIPHNASLDLGVGANDDFTIEMFFYVPDLEYSDTAVDVLARKYHSFSFYIHFHNDEPDRIYITYIIPSYGELLLWHETNISIGWHHVATVFDNEHTADEDYFAIYLDGTRVVNSADEGVRMDWSPGIPHSGMDLEIGGVGQGGFHGYLEEARISDIVRYNSATYTVPTGPFSTDSNTRALWHFNETAGSTTFMDASSYHNDLTGYYGAQTYKP